MSKADSSKEVLSVFKKPLLYAQWTTKIPERKKESLSATFFLESILCQFKLKFNDKMENEVTLDVVDIDGDYVDHELICTILVESGDKVLKNLLAPKIRDSLELHSDYLWTCNVPDQDLSRIEGKIVTFLVVLENADDNDSAREEDNNWNVTFESFKSLSLDFGKLLDDEAYQTDIELLCGDHTIPAHGAVLSARSEVFQKMLTTDMLEKRTGSVKISDIDPTVIKVFLRYIYTGTLPKMTVEMASQLYEAGDKYSVGSLTKECADFLCANVTTDNACEILSLADGHSDLELKEDTINYILKQDIPLKSDQWMEFQNGCPKLAAEVLYRFYQNTKAEN